LNTLHPLLIFGTRPEAIKMAPVVQACRRAERIEPIVCLTGQHREMLAQVIDYFEIGEDEHLDLMTPDQTLSALSARCLEGLDDVVRRRRPDCLVAQGDTTTVMAAAMVAFYHQSPFVHVEAGLRTGNLYAPWPEEFNRRVADMVTTLCCAPTQRAADVLLAEGLPPEAVHVTGNTVIDALLATVERERAAGRPWKEKYAVLGDAPVVLITGHRRESFGEGFERICRAIGLLAGEFPDHRFVYPVHLNPNVAGPVRATLGDRRNIHLVEPVPYPEFVWLMDRARLVLTDSGGVQEEAPSLRKPVVVMREVTERPEAVEAGAARLVGTVVRDIVEVTARLLTDPGEYAASQIDANPYGDGHAAERIVELMLRQGWEKRG